jgi:Xaa-Pro dipeptidase
MNASRIGILQEALREQGLGCTFLVPGPNLRYLTGLQLEAFERVILGIVPPVGDLAFVVPQLEADKVRAHIDAHIHCGAVFPYSDDAGPLDALRQALHALGLGLGLDLGSRIVGAEFLHMRLLDRDIIQQAVGHDECGRSMRFRDLGPIAAHMRAVKDSDELAALQRAAQIVDIGIAAAASAIAPGVTEREVAAATERAMLAAGADSVPFNAVLAGANSALPHGQTSDYAMRDGDMVICDIGATYHGYNGDITRTFAVGKPAPEVARVFGVVYDANRAACQAARPGVTGEQLDSVARDIITRAGFGECFTHRTGHGLGLEIHEEPYIVQGAKKPLEAGMVFTIEPGIYIPGVGGVRIEDDLALTDDGCVVLTAFPRELA